MKYEKVNTSFKNLGLQIVWEATRGDGYNGDIALDDLQIYRDTCRRDTVEGGKLGL